MERYEYEPKFPMSHPVDERVKDFISRFYAISDDASKDEQWVDCFSFRAHVVMGEKSAVGTKSIRALRKGMWEKVLARKHQLLRVYPATFYPASSYVDSPPPAAEYMIEGEVSTIGWRNLACKEMSWAAHAVLVEEQGQLKYRFYQVYLNKKCGTYLDVSLGDRLRVLAGRWLGPFLLLVVMDVMYRMFLA
ncbi:hypothetical protein F4811DRAFT_178150 [Daldinia bambusicola]|nr:hypothetical protein F4811DRAFT_178150 [Daldinia bambusicola]